MSSTFPLLRSCCISCSGLDPKEKSSIHRRVEELGGCISFNLTTAVTHVIMRDNSLSSIKYKMAAKVGIPVVTIQFVANCEKEAERLGKLCGVPQRDVVDNSEVTAPEHSLDSHDTADVVRAVTEKSRLLPFSGCHISSTGVDHGLLEDIKHLVINSEPATHGRFGKYAERGDAEGDEGGGGAAYMQIGGGGTYYNSLTRRCTHLIAANSTSQKFVFAKQWKIHIVTIAWFLDSVKSRFRRDEAMYTFSDDSASFCHIGGEYSSLDRPNEHALSADPELRQADVGIGYRTMSAQTLSLGSSVFSHNHTATSTGDQNESADMPKGLSGSLEADTEYALDLLPNKHHNRLLTQRCKAASDMGTGAPPLIPYTTSDAQPYRARTFSSASKQLHTPPSLLENRWDDSGLGPYKDVTSFGDRPDKQRDPFTAEGGNEILDLHSKRRRLFILGDRSFPRSKTSPGEFGNRDGKRSNRANMWPASSSPEIQLSGPSENSVQVLYSMHPNDPHRVGTSSESRPVELSANNGGADSKGVFSSCIFTSLGFPSNTLAVLQEVISANSGHYVDLFSYVQQPGELNGDSAHAALEAFAHHFSNGKDTKPLYLVIQLCGSKMFEQCYSTAQRYQKPIHVVTECWVEQCIYDGALYPDFQQIEHQSLSYAKLSQGQQVLFRPLPDHRPKGSRAMALSISGYEGLERDHIGKLAVALGIEFSERFSRKATHLICRPPFKGTKYERALKWGTLVVDSTWLYRLAAATALSTEPATRSSAMPAINNATNASDIVYTNQHLAIGTPKRVAFSSIIQDPAPPNQICSAQLTVTPLSKLCGKQNTGTPGRTPIDISLEQNLRWAEENNGRSRRITEPEDSIFLKRTTAMARSKVINCTGDNGGSKGEARNEDITQMSPTSSNRLEYVGSIGKRASSDMGDENKRLEQVLDGVVIALASRIYHRKNELTALALQLGCRVLSRLDTRQTTHLVHQSPREHETLRDYRLALEHKMHIVSPWWLYACRDAHTHVNEADFPYSYHPERRLRLVSNSPSKVQRPSALSSSKAGAVLHKELDTSPQLSRGAHVPAIANSRVGLVRAKASQETVPVVTGPAAIDDLFGKKTTRTRRRYRHTPDNLSSGQAIDSATGQITSRNRNLKSTVPRPNATQPHEQCTPNDDRVGELIGYSNVNTQAGEGPVIAGYSSVGEISRPNDTELAERKKWWLTVESVESTGYQKTGPDDMISQDIGASDDGDFYNIPNTNATEYSLSFSASLDISGKVATHSNNSSSNSSHSSGHLQTTTEKARLAPGQKTCLEVDAQHSKSATSPLGVRGGTMIVYSEDADIISERDRLIQKLTKR